MADNPRFKEFLLQVRDTTTDAYSHQDLPFEMVVEALQVERDLSHLPLVQVMFSLENDITTDIKFEGITTRSLSVESATSKFDLLLGMEHTPDGLAGVWEYNTDLFDASTIERMAAHWGTLLDGIVADPDQRVAQLPLLSAAERQQLLVNWSQSQDSYSVKYDVHQLFEQQAERVPDAVAVVYEDTHLSYGELNSSGQPTRPLPPGAGGGTGEFGGYLC